MGSEVRRAALALMARREERFATRRPAADARERLERTLAPLSFSRVTVRHEWVEGPHGIELVVHLAPVAALERWLRGASFVLVALLAASVWVISSPETSRSVAFLVPMAAGFAIFALPIVGAALGSQREGEEARLRKAIRGALSSDAP